MPRTHGRIMAAIWNDPDFLALAGGAQRLYMFLLSQPDLSHAGLVPMRLRRWAKKSADSDTGQIEDTLHDLAKAGFVVVDLDTEEVLVRTFVRNDGVYKQPRVMDRLREDAKQIESPHLRAAFRAELERLPLGELSAEPGGPNRDKPSTREQVERVMVGLRADFAEGMPDPPDGVSNTPRVRAGVFHQPPTPIPQPPTTSHEEPPSSDKSDHTELLDHFEAFWETYSKKIGRAKAETAYRNALKKPGVTPALLEATAAAYITWQISEGKHPQFTKDATTWLHGEHWRDERKDVQAPRTRVQEHLALVQQLAAEEDQPNVRQIGDRP